MGCDNCGKCKKCKVKVKKYKSCDCGRCNRCKKVKKHKSCSCGKCNRCKKKKVYVSCSSSSSCSYSCSSSSSSRCKTGATGNTGGTGNTGNTGNTGATGEQGKQGVQGIPGVVSNSVGIFTTYNNGKTIPISNSGNLVFDTIVTGGSDISFDLATGTITLSSAGYYDLDFNCFLDVNNSPQPPSVSLYVNGVVYNIYTGVNNSISFTGYYAFGGGTTISIRNPNPTITTLLYNNGYINCSFRIRKY